MRAAHRRPGPATEIWLYRYERGFRVPGGRRSLLHVGAAGTDVAANIAGVWGPGRYRIEYRDARRYIVRVRVFEVPLGGTRPVHVRPRVRARRVPPARALPTSPSAPLIDRSRAGGAPPRSPESEAGRAARSPRPDRGSP